MRTVSTMAQRSSYSLQDIADLNGTLGVLKGKNVAPNTTGWPYFQIQAQHMTSAAVAPAAVLAKINKQTIGH